MLPTKKVRKLINQSQKARAGPPKRGAKESNTPPTKKKPTAHEEKNGVGCLPWGEGDEKRET